MQLRQANPRRQGDIGELAAMQWLVANGYAVYLPFGHSPDVDMVAQEPRGRLLRVQVKTTTHVRRGRYEVGLCTHGGNQSWNGLVKRLDPSRYDRLFVLVADGRIWFIPAGAVEGGRKIMLGGPKYARYEVGDHVDDLRLEGI